MISCHTQYCTAPFPLTTVFHETKTPVQAAELEQIVAEIPFPIGIKQLLMVIEMASSSHQENIIDDGKVRM